MSENTSTIIYTFTDEAPALATYSFLPIIEAFAGVAGVEVETRDISLAGRIIATFPERLTDEQRIGDALAELGELALDAGGEHHQAAEHLGVGAADEGGDRRAAGQGLRHPDYPDEPSTPDEVEVRARYGTVMGSAVNPVLRQGNSDRRAPKAVKDYAKSQPAFDGRLVARLQDPRRHDGRPRLPRRTSSRSPSPPTVRCASSTSAPTAPSPCSRSRCRCSPAR